MTPTTMRARIRQATLVVVPAVLTFAVSTVLRVPDALDAPAPAAVPEQVHLVVRASDRVPKRSWVAVDEQAWTRIRNSDPLGDTPDDCAGLLAWARQHDLNPSAPLPHLLTVTAKDRVHVRFQNVYASQTPRESTPQRAPAARLHLDCGNAAGAEGRHELERIAGRTFPATERPEPEGLFENHVFDMSQGAETVLWLDLDSLPGTPSYDYDVVVTLEVDGSPRRFTLNDAGRPFRRR
jgi:hypothetical protein